MIVPLYRVNGPNRQCCYAIVLASVECKWEKKRYDIRTMLYVRTQYDKPYQKRYIRKFHEAWMTEVGTFDTDTLNPDWLINWEGLG